jgi:hypothetical protein
MPTSKSKTKTKSRKENKLRPYRVDYFLHQEMLKDKCLVRSKIVRAVTAKEASDDLASILPISDGELTIIKSARFYKTLSAEPKKKTYIPIDKLLSAKAAIEVMTEIENRKVPIVIRPEDLGIKPKIDPTTLSQDHPDHVCTDKCYDIVPLNDAKAIEAVRNLLADPNPDRNYKYGDPQPATVLDTDTSNVAAGQPSPYVFPNKPLTPTKDATFDGGDEVVIRAGFAICRWHGWKYIDLRDGRCTATDSGSGFYYDTKYKTELVFKQAADAFQQFGNAVAKTDEGAKEFAGVAPRNIDLDEAAPVVNPAPTALDDGRYDEPAVYDDSGFRRDPAQAVERPSKAPLITLATIAAIVGLVLAYFHWFKH